MSIGLPQLGTSKRITQWLAATLVLSLVAMLDGGFLVKWLSLSPGHVVRGQIWRLGTWILVERGFWDLGLTLGAIYKFGSELGAVWGDRRLVRFIAQIVIAVGVVTTLASVLGIIWPIPRLGGWAVGDILVIAWARQFPTRVLRIQGMVSVYGQNLIWLTLGVAVVATIYWGLTFTLPDVLACAFAMLYPREWLNRLGSRRRSR